MIAILVALSISVISTPTFPDVLKTIILLDRMPYAEGVKVSDEVRAECKLETKLAESVKTHLEKTHFKVSVTQEEDIKRGGKFLDVRMIGVHADEFGWSWQTGGGSMVTIKAELKENGEMTNTFSYYRHSNRRFSGVCELLENCVNALGKDIARWIVRISPPPSNKAVPPEEETPSKEDMGD